MTGALVRMGARSVGLMALCSCAACAPRTASVGELASFRALRGELVTAQELSAPPRGQYAVERIRLAGSTGLATSGWLYRPAGAGGCYPAVLLQDGREENSTVIGRLPAEFGDVVVLSLDYPSAMPATLRLRDVALHSSRVKRAAREIPALFSLGAAYLAQRGDVDTTRIAVAATSFAVPFAIIAAAADPRFRNVTLIYGAGDLPRVLAANLTLRPRALRAPVAWLAMRPFADLAPERFIGLIAPRPVVMVNGIDDPQMPAEAARVLYAAARPPKSITWLRTGHLMPTDSALIRTLVDTAFAQLPVLHAPAESRRCLRQP